MTDEKLYSVVFDQADGQTTTIKSGASLREARTSLRRWKITLGKLPEWNPRILDSEGNEVPE